MLASYLEGNVCFARSLEQVSWEWSFDYVTATLLLVNQWSGVKRIFGNLPDVFSHQLGEAARQFPLMIEPVDFNGQNHPQAPKLRQKNGLLLDYFGKRWDQIFPQPFRGQ